MEGIKHINKGLPTETKVNKGYKQTKIGIIPEDWELIQLEHLFEFKNGVNADKGSYGKGIKFINVMEVINNNKLTHDLIKGSITLDEKQIKPNLIEYGDVLFNRTSETTIEIGLTSVYLDTEKVIFGGFVIRGRSKNSKLFNQFKKDCFRSSILRKQIIVRGQGVVRSNIGQKDLSTVLFPLPPLPEQEKIAAILSSWDEGIQQLESTIKTLKKRNKGLAQQLLTGKLRLKKFTDKWEKIKLGKLLIESRIPSKNPNPAKRISVKLNLKGVKKRLERGTEALYSTAYFTRNAGQFIYGKQNLHKGALGVIPIGLDGFESTQDIPTFNFTELVIPNWFIHFIGRESFYSQLENISTGTGSKRIHPKNLFKISILLPSIKEQEAIANVLETADAELQLNQQKLNTLQEQKKGLMQKLLTGEVRVDC